MAEPTAPTLDWLDDRPPLPPHVPLKSHTAGYVEPKQAVPVAPPTAPAAGDGAGLTEDEADELARHMWLEEQTSVLYPHYYWRMASFDQERVKELPWVVGHENLAALANNALDAMYKTFKYENKGVADYSTFEAFIQWLRSTGYLCFKPTGEARWLAE